MPATEQETSSPQVHVKLERLYRLYNPGNSDHFYTTDPSERDRAVAGGYTYESVSGLVLPKKTIRESEPLYRIYRDSKDHFYTTSAAERAQVLAQPNTVDEGIACYVYNKELSFTIPLYRLFNPILNDHFYTIDAQEREIRIAENQYKDEGITGYVYPPSYTGAIA